MLVAVAASPDPPLATSDERLGVVGHARPVGRREVTACLDIGEEHVVLGRERWVLLFTVGATRSAEAAGPWIVLQRLVLFAPTLAPIIHRRVYI